jgi:hypothetical protein
MILPSKPTRIAPSPPKSLPPVPHWNKGRVVIKPPGHGPGHWAGASNALAHDGWIYLTCRLRRPLGQGRGIGVFVARSKKGVSFETLAHIKKEEMDAESLERAALAVTPNGKWRLYLSCATANTKHWRIEMLEAENPESLKARERRVVLPGNVDLAVKDPVIAFRNGRWEMWVTCHPLDQGDSEADRMYSALTTSKDGINWSRLKTVLRGRPGHWDSRGARITSVLYHRDTPIVAYYDGRASAEENFEERTGIAFWDEKEGQFIQTEDEPMGTPYGGLRYLTQIGFADGRRRYYFEGRRRDGAHELRTELIPAPASSKSPR